MDFKLADKTVLITGAASNIGRAIALKFAAEGATVVILDIDSAQGEKTALDIRGAGGRVIFQAADVTDSASVASALAVVGETVGPLDVLVNNVGWSGELGYFLGIDPDRWDKAYRLNLLPVFTMTHAVLPLMVERRKGAIISIASDTGFGMTHTSEYGAMKAGVMNFSRSIAIEYGRYNIRSNVVCPGLVIPDPESIGSGSFWKNGIGYSDKEAQALAAQVPMRVLPTAEDIADATIFFASSAARILTGQVLSVSGGFQMPR